MDFDQQNLRASWRKCQNAEDFARLVNMNAKATTFLGFLYIQDKGKKDVEFVPCLKGAAENYMSLIQQVLVDEGYKNLNWFERHVAEDRVDDLIVCFAGLSEKIPDFPLAPGPKFHKDYYQVMHDVVPVIEEKQTPSLDSRSESEFDSNQEDHGGTEDPDLISAEAVIKAGWRECKDAQQFVDLVGLGNMAA